MTINTTTASIDFAGNGVTTTFSFPFVPDQASDLIVVYIDATGAQTTLDPAVYTVTINTPPVGGLWGIGGTVTYPISGTPIQPGTLLRVFRAIPYTQNFSIANQSAMYPQVIEQALDVLEMQIQQVANAISKTVIPPTPTVNVFRVVGGTPGRKPNAGEEIFNIPMYSGDSLLNTGPYGPTHWQLEAEVAPTSNWIFTIKVNGVSKGTGTILAGQTVGTYVFALEYDFATGDAFSFWAPGSQDGTGSGVSFAILGNRTL